MKIGLFLLVHLFSICAGAASPSRNTPQPEGWYKHLKGTVGKYPITMHLHRHAEGYAGFYYYESTQEPIYFTGDDTTQLGKIHLRVFGERMEQDEHFVFGLKGSEAVGSWKKDKTTLAFEARALPDSFQFSYVYTSGTMNFQGMESDSAYWPRANFEYSTVWPQAKTTATEFLRNELLEMAWIRDEPLPNPTPEYIHPILALNQAAFFQDYLEEHKDVTPEQVKEFSFSFNLEELHQVMIVYRSPRFIVLTQFLYTYTGGAHGNYGSNYVVLNLGKKKILKLSDILTEQGIKMLPALLEANFRKKFGLKPGESLMEGGLFENRLLPNENFFITGKGIGFNYVPYEVAPYVMGEFQVFIPFSELGKEVRNF